MKNWSFLVTLIPFLSLAEVPSDYEVVSTYPPIQDKVDCVSVPTRYHVKNLTSGLNKSIFISDPCKVVAFELEESSDINVWGSANAYRISVQSSYTKQSLTDWLIKQESGNCHASTYELYNSKTQETITTTIDNVCQKINFYHGHKVKHNYVVSSQVAKILGYNTTLGCDAIVNNDESLRTAIDAAQPDNNGYHICLERGNYKAITIQDKHNITFSGINGMATFEDEIVMIGGATQNSVVHLVNSTNINFFNINITNNKLFKADRDDNDPQNSNPQVSRALQATNSNNIGIYYANIESHGKQAIQLDNSSIVIKDSNINCFYFCIDSYYSNVDILDVSVHAFHETYSPDGHSVFWTYFSDFNITNLNLTASTGKGLFSGTANSDRNKIRIYGKTQIEGNLQAWVQNHFNYSGIEITLFGVEGQNYPVLNDFFNNQFLGGGSSYDSRVIKVLSN
ncbi:hypothetical protein [Pseudoalteromonas luteoviolacea]|uniref:Uncharacterized protein n=1 Tax=Pseudoalteromonas luteoviolacea (strain 2ta16) TaxID=1353533 RepID=V4H2S2_PSEL2|nr:hypothetical protein [Pseudoalteromonas luteoviolacea]ESP91761.1 hypothetical protein PL2TA16_05402 [Pseudoalteromonas luteoviolacea 2ta16]KZN40760.1 hypothetical protein N483_16660 [Pseudoalteromonas luteoviolacea NCIMB 1944]